MAMEVHFTTLISSMTQPVCSFVPCFMAERCARVCSAQPQTLFLSSGRHRDDPESDTFTKLLQILSHSSNFVPSLPLGYPIALLAMSIILPFQTAILLNAAFVGFFILGQQVLSGDDDDSPPMNLLALFAAVGSAGLLSPAGLEPTGNHLASVTIAATALALAGASLFVDNDEHHIHDDEDKLSSLDWSAMQEWDDKLRHEEQDDKNNKQ